MLPSFFDSLPSYIKNRTYADSLSLISKPAISSIMESMQKYDSITKAFEPLHKLSARDFMRSPISDAISAYRLADQSNLMSILQEQHRHVNIIFKAASEFQNLKSSVYNSLNLSFAKSLFSRNFTIPNSILSSIKSINSHHEKFRALFESINKSIPLTNFQNHNWNSLFQAYNKSLSHLVSISLENRHWNEVINIEELEEVIADYPLGGISFGDLYKKINELVANGRIKVEDFLKKHVALFTLIFGLMECWNIYKSEYGYYKDSQPQEQPAILNTLATKEDISSIKGEIKDLTERINNQAKYRISRNCKVYFKPNNNSKVVDTIIDYNVTLLQTNHKWVLISYIKGENDICTGWILKKYLD